MDFDGNERSHWLKKDSIAESDFVVFFAVFLMVTGDVDTSGRGVNKSS